MQQCGHEYAIDKSFLIEKYESRWLLPKVYKQYFQNSVDAVMDNEDDDLGLSDLNVTIDDDDPQLTIDTGTDPANMHLEDVGPTDSEKRNSGPTDSEKRNSIPPATVSYHDLRQAASELVEAAGQSSDLRLYAHHFLNEMTSLIRTGSTTHIEAGLSSTILPDMLTRFTRASQSTSLFTNIKGETHPSPLRARPPQGGPTNVLRKRTIMEARPSNKRG
jgi:hypothetical protein